MVKNTKLGTYLLTRTPKIEERVMVINEHNVFFERWGTVINMDQTFPEVYKVKLDDIQPDIWFCRFEIAWDHGT
jgi:hypothetical protein